MTIQVREAEVLDRGLVRYGALKAMIGKGHWQNRGGMVYAARIKTKTGVEA